MKAGNIFSQALNYFSGNPAYPGIQIKYKSLLLF
ncbi:MAG: hypothetical protein JWO09_2288 [Bacteroidetes bacterium]|nr:hypothetical protein [Bacteroidota bacterium]